MRMWMLGAAGLGLLLSTALAGPAEAAGAIYRWETDSGTLAFTDDARRIPERYRGSVQTLERRSLRSHARFTPTDPEAALRYAEQLAERLERLRALNGFSDESAAPAAVVPPDREHTVRLRTGQGPGSLDFSVDEEAGPIVVETRRMRDPETGATRLITVVRQGDRILSMVKPRRRVYQLPFGSLGDLEAAR